MRKRIKQYIHTLESECKMTEDKQELAASNKIISRLKDIVNHVEKHDLKDVIKAYIVTLKIREKKSPTASLKKFHEEVAKNLKRILKKG